MPVQPAELEDVRQRAYPTASSLPAQYPATRELHWQTFENLIAALPPEEPQLRPVRTHERGAVVGYERPVEVNTGETTVVDGLLKVFKRRVWRRVALCLSDAREASGKGIETDFWNGWTWVRRGQKPERDFATSFDQDRSRADDLFLEDAPPADQLAAQAVIAQQTAAISASLVAAPKPRKEST